MSIAIGFRDNKLSGLQRDIRFGHAWLWHSVWAMLICASVLLTLEIFDHRLINGVNVWDKPAKFFIAVALQFATVSWALNFLQIKTRATEVAIYMMVISGWGENVYIATRAAFGLTSHFNNTTVFSSIAYGIMGVGALTLTATAYFIGWQIWRQSPRGLWVQAASLGLMAGAILGTIAGGYMAQRTGHWVGGEMSDAHGLALFGWSTSGGDLRVAHFIGLHAAQIIPLSALSGDKTVVWFATLGITLVTVAIFVMGIAGMPLFKI